MLESLCTDTIIGVSIEELILVRISMTDTIIGVSIEELILVRISMYRHNNRCLYRGTDSS